MSTLPGPGDTVEYQKDIKPLFREMDRKAMRGAFDLWSYTDVKTHADAILDVLRKGSMPCDAPWPSDRVDLFARWVTGGKLE